MTCEFGKMVVGSRLSYPVDTYAAAYIVAQNTCEDINEVENKMKTAGS